MQGGSTHAPPSTLSPEGDAETLLLRLVSPRQPAADGERVHLADFGLATSAAFEFNDDERRFLTTNRSHDVAYAITRLVNWLVTQTADVNDWLDRKAYVERCARGDEHPAGFGASVISRFAPVAAVVNDFYRQLYTEDRRTPYPADRVERACSEASLAFGGS